MILYIIRHGESLGNTGEDTGTDPLLSSKGEEQAALLAARMAETQLDFIIASPLKRAIQTAEKTAAVKNLNIEIEPMIAEVENGETKDSAYSRALQVVHKLKERFSEDERVVLFAHGTFNNYLINAAIGFPVRDDFNFCQENTGITCIKFLSDGRTKIEFSNDYCHLAPLGEIEY